MFVLGEFLDKKCNFNLNYKIRTFLNNLTQWPYYFKDGIRNLILWFPLIWKDQQWDRNYLYKIMIFKLRLMQDFFESNKTNVADADKLAEQIEDAKHALIRIEKDDYMLPEYRRIINCEYYIENKHTFKQTAEYNKLIKENMKFEQKSFEEDFKIFCDIFKNHSLGWWD